ncbi:tyrosine-type recombinase/integrase [Litorisediminicola beolgyonensis]|uniref:Tyrosine-type recombinase/integrase n=1 Tax=Litorisediminicola beolgyonensis TaxID=1173614 RepID=A0ABW3ZN24_9RHOB
MPLTHAQCLTAQPAAKAYRLKDGDGLVLNVRPSGSKSWQFGFRHDGRTQTLTYGSFPDLGLAAARRLHQAAQAEIAAGRNPKTANTAYAGLAANSFAAVARDWFKIQRENWSRGHATRVWERVEKDLFPALGHRPIDEINPPELLAAIRAIEERGVIETARRCNQYAGSIFAFGIAEGRAVSNPAPQIVKALRKTPRKRQQPWINESALPSFFRSLEMTHAHEHSKIAIRLLTRVFLRDTELVELRFGEIEEDFIRIPASRMKNGLDHVVPLTNSTRALLDRAVALARERRLANARGRAAMSGKPPPPGAADLLPEDRVFKIVRGTLIQLIYKMGYKGKCSVHGFRSTASTAMNESGLWRPDVIERQLAHVELNKIRGAYNAAEYLAERRAMMQWWSDRVDAYEAEGLNAPSRKRDPLDDLLG